MKKTLCIIATLAVLLFTLCCAAAQADGEPWSGSGTESDPWLINSAEDLAAIHGYIMAGGATAGKYYLITQDIGLEAYCGGGTGDWTPIGTYVNSSFDFTYCFKGVLDGGGHTLSGLYIGNGGKFSGLFTATEDQSVIKNLTVTGFVQGTGLSGGFIGYHRGLIRNCRFIGDVRGTEASVGGIAGMGADVSNCIDCSVEGTVWNSGENTGGIMGRGRGHIGNCHFTGKVTGAANDTGGIAGYAAPTSSFADCTAHGTIEGKSGVGGIVGICNGTVTGCVNYCEVSGYGTTIGGITGNSSKAISNCTNNGYVHAGQAYVGGITGRIWSNYGSSGTVENCINNGRVEAPYAAAGIVSHADEGFVRGCANHGIINGEQYAAAIASFSWVDIRECTNDGSVNGFPGPLIADSRFSAVDLTLWSNIPGNDEKMTLHSATPTPLIDCPFEYSGYVFFGWNTAADAGGTYYLPGFEITADITEMTLYAIWMKVVGDTESAGTIWAPWGLESNFTNLLSGWYAAGNLTFTERVIINGDVNLVIPTGFSVNATKGITVSAGNSLTVWGEGTLTATGDRHFSAIGGDDTESGRNCGEITVNGITLNATGGYYGAGIGGGDEGNGGTVTINSGTVTVTGGYYASAIGGGDNGNGGAVTVNDGTVTATGGNYGAGIGGGDEGRGAEVTIYGGSVTATGCEGAAGIGGGDYGNAGDVHVYGGRVVATGSTRSKTGQAASGIGAGRPDGSNHRIAGDLHVYGGTVIAVAGIPSGSGQGAQAAGVNFADQDHWSNVNPGLIKLPESGYRVFAGNDLNSLLPVEYADRRAAFHQSCAKTEPCAEHELDGDMCRYCGLRLTKSGEGTAESPYLILDEWDWRQLGEFMELGFDTSGKYFRLVTNIPVRTAVGTPENPFGGVFDCSRSSILFLELSGEDDYLAPFRYADGAEFRNLRISGWVNGGMHCSALVGRVFGGITIENCFNGAEITTSGTHCGGYIGHAGTSSSVLRGCLFDGSISEAEHAATFWGWSDSGANALICDCADLSSVSYPIGLGAGTVCVTNTYYTNPEKTSGTYRPWSSGGKLAHKIIQGDEAILDFGEPTATYAISRITAYETGMSYAGTRFAAAGETISLTLSPSDVSPDFTSVFDVTAGTLAKNGSAWTLTMPDEDVTVFAWLAPRFGTPDFRLPAALTQIRAEAFAGAAMTVVDIPATCTMIGDRAFKDCAQLWQIRIPAGCALGEDVFDGCSHVYVYGEAGCPAEAYCAAHKNCVFVDISPAQ